MCINEGLILSILLYGCESWSLPKLLLNRLQIFHNRCVRAMCRVSMWHVREYRITQANLESRLQLEPFKFYLARRRLRWAGHVSRMPMTRIPRMLLSSGWITSARSNDHNSTTAMVLEGIFAMQASTSTIGPLWRVTAKYGTSSLNKKMFTVTPTAVAISGSTQTSWLKRLRRILCHHRSPTLESCLAY